MRILITGSDGVIARELRALLRDEHELLLVDKKSGYNLATQDMQPIINFSPEAVFHLAASFERPDESPGFLRINREDNILATERLNQALVKTFDLKSYVFASSYLIYDPSLYSGQWVHPAVPLTEASKISPRNLCGAAKLYAENQIDFLKRNFFKEMNVAHARIFRVYGKNSQDFISRSVRWRLDGTPVDIWNDDNSFDYIHAADVAKALLCLFQNQANGIYNVSTGKSTSIRTIANLIGFKERRVENHDQFENSYGDNRKLKELGWSPSIDIESGIKDIISWEESRKYQAQA